MTTLVGPNPLSEIIYFVSSFIFLFNASIKLSIFEEIAKTNVPFYSGTFNDIFILKVCPIILLSYKNPIK